MRHRTQWTASRAFASLATTTVVYTMTVSTETTAARMELFDWKAGKRAYLSQRGTIDEAYKVRRGSTWQLRG
ncbi:hypothetical protein BO94DRAFT_87640 [Aspergillus sclerotioniger CBS 115572]|uniref:Uncharacterized protein n=1 Tax=Aspergillus sclerotioniger CBS 115572 TaxID=1450535 RepID=A0A317WJV3_9EURO|nr:hypothetical protein BO94DRAFT_87640 [Aspergillus sclerotioniger CBS 115572]PWY86609.1 hypothetical protein BO94DRAFT_87640 [Aspergillus sclerotioniger CBS 115572]